MSIFDDLYTSERGAVVKMAAYLIDSERDRIVSNGLASHKDINALVHSFIDSMRHKVALGQSVGDNELAYFHRQLKSIVLPGDFSKVSGDFYDLSSLPKMKEKEDGLKYELPESDLSEETLESAEEELKEFMDEEQEANDCPDDCSCGCKDEACDVAPEEEFSIVMLGRLEETAYKLGSVGKHVEAYEVEQVIRNIRNFMEEKTKGC